MTAPPQDVQSAGQELAYGVSLPRLEIFTELVEQRNKSAPEPTNYVQSVESAPPTRLFQRYENAHGPGTYLKAIEEGRVAPIFLVSGASGVGKSHVVGLLEQVGVSPTPRFVSRPLRAGDSSLDTVWHPATDERDLILRYGKFGAEYGFSKDVLTSAFEGRPSTIIIGDLSKALRFIEAIDKEMPLVPVSLLRVDCPLDVAMGRMVRRNEAFQGEAQQRDQVNHAIERWEAAQLPEVKALVGMHTVINLTPDEIKEHGYDRKQIQPLSIALVDDLSHRFVGENVTLARTFAKVLRREASLKPDTEQVPESVYEVLSRIVAASDELGQSYAIKGGLAVWLYSADAHQNPRDYEEFSRIDRNRILLRCEPMQAPYARPVSLDIDFALANFSEVGQFSYLLSSIGARYSDPRDFREKPMFKSYKLSGQLDAPNGEMVELDGIIVSRVKPKESPFCFSFEGDPVFALHARVFDIQGVGKVRAVAPETLVIEKLLAARGADLNKYDLQDAATLFSSQPIRFELVHRAMQVQTFSAKAEFDDAIVASLVADNSPEDWKANLDLFCKALGFHNRHIIEALRTRLCADESATDPRSIVVPFALTATHLKQIAFLDRLLQGVEQIAALIDTNAGEAALVKKKLHVFKKFILDLATYQVGRWDVEVF